MTLIDLTHSTTRKTASPDAVPVVVRSADPIHLVPLGNLVTPATVIDLTERPDPSVITRQDVSRVGVSDIGGCILRTDWCDDYISGVRSQAPTLTIAAASYLLQGGVRTVAADFPITSDAADLLLHNNCVLVHCISNVSELSKSIVRLVALPLKLDDTFSAEARVIAIED
ncbi:MAG: cyclase family protein [Armatimonadota bacterium]